MMAAIMKMKQVIVVMSMGKEMILMEKLVRSLFPLPCCALLPLLGVEMKNFVKKRTSGISIKKNWMT